MKRILFVEDDLTIIRIYRTKFQNEGFDVEVATDGEIAIDYLKKSTPNLVLLDLQLPKVNGVQVLKYIRAQPQTKDLPVIVFTNAFLSELVQQACDAGATKCLTKASCTPRQLLDVLRSALASAPNAGGQSASSPSPAKASAPAAPNLSGNIPATEALTSLAREASSWSSSVVSATAPPTLLNKIRGGGAADGSNPLTQPLASNPASAPGKDTADAQSQLLIRKFFLDSSPSTLTVLRTQLSAVSRNDSDATRRQSLEELFKTVHSVTGNAGLAGFARIAQLSSVLEALLLELHDKPKNLNASSLRTLASAVDVLGSLFQNGADPTLDALPSSLSLVVDDDPVCSRAVSTALNKANLKSISLNDPQQALQIAEINHFDLIFLDVEMPGMNGLELAGKLRTLESNQNTPITFVTTLSDFETRARTILSGGNDLIAKPFLLIELAVKALTYLLRPPPVAKTMAKAA